MVSAKHNSWAALVLLEFNGTVVPNLFCQVHLVCHVSECHPFFLSLYESKCAFQVYGTLCNERSYYWWWSVPHVVSVLHCMGFGISTSLTFWPGSTVTGITSVKSAKRLIFQQFGSANLWYQFPLCRKFPLEPLQWIYGLLVVIAARLLKCWVIPEKFLFIY